MDGSQPKGALTIFKASVNWPCCKAVPRKNAPSWLPYKLNWLIDVRAPHDGIAVFGAVDDWLGRPVVTGERIVQMANPASAGLDLFTRHGCVGAGRECAGEGVFNSSAFVAFSGPCGANQLPGKFVAGQCGQLSFAGEPGQGCGAVEEARIGLRGTAKISGGWVPGVLPAASAFGHFTGLEWLVMPELVS